MRRRWIAILGVTAAACLTPARAEAPAALAPLAFLVGSWEAGANTGALGPGTGWCAFSRDLQDHVIVRTNHAEYPPSNGAPGRRHDDLMVIFPTAAGGVEASYFDNEDHAIHYVVTSSAPNEATFVSDLVAGAPRFRLAYRLRADGLLAGEFSMAPPGQPDAWKPYLTWEMKRSSSR